jgi:hypothetical protein
MKLFIAAIAVILAIPIVVGLGGGFFSQRCAAAFPGNGYKQELCVERLSAGKSIEGLQ